MSAAPLTLRWLRALTETDPADLASTKAHVTGRTVREVGTRAVLYGDTDGRSIFPGIDRLARDLHLSERTVRRALAALVERGWLVVESSGRGGRPDRATAYRADLPNRTSGGPIGGQGATGPLEVRLEGTSNGPLEDRLDGETNRTSGGPVVEVPNGPLEVQSDRTGDDTPNGPLEVQSNRTSGGPNTALVTDPCTSSSDRGEWSPPVEMSPPVGRTREDIEDEEGDVTTDSAHTFTVSQEIEDEDRRGAHTFTSTRNIDPEATGAREAPLSADAQAALAIARARAANPYWTGPLFDVLAAVAGASEPRAHHRRRVPEVEAELVDSGLVVRGASGGLQFPSSREVSA